MHRLVFVTLDTGLGRGRRRWGRGRGRGRVRVRVSVSVSVTEWWWWWWRGCGKEGTAAAAEHKCALDPDAGLLAGLDGKPSQLIKNERVVGAKSRLQDLLGLLQVLEGQCAFHVVQLNLAQLEEEEAVDRVLLPVIEPVA